MEELRDARGLTEAEFLAGYNADKYPHPSLTADILIFDREGRLLLIRRKGHPFMGSWALPGGFVEKGESAEEAAARELEEETGVTGAAIQPAGFFSGPGRDPRGWTVTRSFVAPLPEGVTPEAGDDAADAGWFTPVVLVEGDRVSLTLSGDGENLSADVKVIRRDGLLGKSLELGAYTQEGIAFDHGKIILDALWRMGVWA